MTEVIIEVTESGYINAYSYSDAGEQLVKERILKDLEDTLGNDWAIHTINDSGRKLIINPEYIRSLELRWLLDVDIYCLPVSSTWVITSVISS